MEWKYFLLYLTCLLAFVVTHDWTLEFGNENTREGQDGFSWHDQPGFPLCAGCPYTGRPWKWVTPIYGEGSGYSYPINQIEF